MDSLTYSVSDTIHIIVPLGKYHIPCAKWRNCKPSFPVFFSDFKIFFHVYKKTETSKIARKISLDIAQYLLFESIKSSLFVSALIC